jgi:diacylglycerol kinase family enzyme
MLVILNRGSGAGKAGMRWDRTGEAIINKAGLGGEEIFIVESESQVEISMKEALKDGETLIVAAGGDGTFNRMVSHLMKIDEDMRKDVVLGAIGLGSSNDLHKPMDGNQIMNGIPYRLDHIRSRKANIIRIQITDPKGNKRVVYSVVNSSFGIISRGNLIFNCSRGLAGLLKRIWTPLGIYSAAIIAVITFKPFQSQIIIDGKERIESVTNLSVLLTPFFTGNLVYDTPIDPYEDYFLVNLVEGMGILGRIGIFLRIIRGKFKHQTKCHSWKAKEMSFLPEKAVNVEFDGEVDTVSRAEFQLIRGGIRICA